MFHCVESEPHWSRSSTTLKYFSSTSKHLFTSSCFSALFQFTHKKKKLEVEEIFKEFFVLCFVDASNTLTSVVHRALMSFFHVLHRYMQPSHQNSKD